MRRALAALLAVGMIVAAVVARSVIDDEVEQSKAAIRLTCTPELAAVCAQIQATSADKVAYVIEAPSVTADKLIKHAEGRAAPLDAWLAPPPWATAVNDGRARNGATALLDVDDKVLARTPLVLVAWKDRARVVAAHCEGGVIGWKCVGEVAGRGWADLGGPPAWGKVKVGHASVGTSGVGPLALGQAVAAWFGRVDVSRADLEVDDTYASWVRNLEAQVRAGAAGNAVSSPVERMAIQRQSAYDIVAATEAETATLFAASPTFAATVQTVYSSPVATVDVRAVIVRTSREAARARAALRSENVTAALRSAGWRADGATRPVGAGASAPSTLPASSGLLSDGVLEYLYRTWKEK